MKILLVVKSKHNDNTMKVAEAMSEAAPVTLTELSNASYYKLSEYDIVGFGSGIYFGKHDKELFKFVKALHDNKQFCFVFSTSCSKAFDKNNSKLIKLLEHKNKTVLGSFGCLGSFGILKKEHPNIDDYDAAQNFILSAMEKYEKLK